MSASSTPFDPDAIASFTIDAAVWTGDDELELRYGFDGGHRFVERYRFDIPAGVPRVAAPGEALRRATALLHLTASLSYYKAALPPQVTVRTPLESGSAAELLGVLTDDGLAEMRHRADVGDRGVRPELDVEGGVPVVVPTRAGDIVRPVIVPIGGGKDSLVTLDLVRRAGRSPILFAVTTFGDPLASLTLDPTLPVVRVQRTIDPYLLELNRSGALNGHVPITAVIMSAALVAATMVGAAEVVMANERDASIPTLVVDGRPVNHQFSKSWEFERRFADVIAREVGSVEVFSLLRPVSEAAIFGHFATLAEFVPQISSCNQVRTRGGGSEQGVRWCGDCPKCRYSFLGLAAYSPAATVLDVFGGRDLLDDEASVEDYLGLLELEGRERPFECIGVSSDARYLMRLVLDRGELADTVVARRVAPLLGEVEAPWLGGPNLVPEEYWPVLRTLA